jgi:hypothetical protein
MGDNLILRMSSIVPQVNKQMRDDPTAMANLAAKIFPDYSPTWGGLDAFSKSFKTGGAAGSEDKKTQQEEEGQIEGVEILEFLKWDIHADVCGRDLVSSLNFIWVTARFSVLFMQIEENLRKVRNPIYVKVYEENPTLMREKRLSLAVGALQGDDEQCLRIMAEGFQNPRSGFMNFIYWEDLDTDIDKMRSAFRKDKDGIDEMMDSQCTVV